MPEQPVQRQSKEQLHARLWEQLLAATLRESDWNLQMALDAAAQGFGGKLTIYIPNAAEKSATRKSLERSCDISFSGRDVYTWDSGLI
jgi:hypothetical protein